MTDSEIDESLVVVVIDMNEALWKKRAVVQAKSINGGAACEPLLLPQVLDVVLLFLNTVLLLNRENKVAAIASCPNGKFSFLFPGVRENGKVDIASADPQKLEKTFKKVRKCGFQRDDLRRYGSAL